MDVALRTLPSVLPVLDFSTIKNELFPVVATVFSRTSSLAIKVRGLQAFVILCGGSTDAATDDGLNGLVENKKKTSSSSALDKYTMQEKVVPLVKAIKTKEPAVMLAALNVLRMVGETADADFVAMDILPILWSMSLGPLLDLRQFQTFMQLIKNLSRRVEDEQTKKLQELSGSANAGKAGPNEDFLAFGGVTGTAFDDNNGTGGNGDDFEALVKGKRGISPSSSRGTNNNGFSGWDETPSVMSAVKSASSTPKTPSFSWSTHVPASPSTTSQPTMGNQPGFRAATPDLARFGTLAPSSTQYSQPLQPTTSPSAPALRPPPAQQPSSSVNWPATAATTPNPWASSYSSPSATYTSHSSHTPTAAGSSLGGMNSAMSNMTTLGQGQGRPPLGGGASSRNPSFSIPPPPGSTSSPSTSFSFGIKPPPTQSQANWSALGSVKAPGTTAGQQKSGLDQYESLI